MTTRVFEPNAVLIPEDAVDKKHGGEITVDPKMCTLLFLDGDRLSGLLFTKEGWKPNGVAAFALEDGMYYRVLDRSGFVYRDPFCRAGLGIKDQEPPVPFPRIQLLPDMWVLKVDETEYWEGLEEVKIKRVFGVYLLNKRAAHHLCEVTPSYELRRLDSQFEPAWSDKDYENRDELNEAAYEHIYKGDADSEDTSYVHCSDVEKQLKTVLRPHFGDLPKGHAGGYQWVGLKAVTEEDAIEEIREATRNGDL